MTNTHLPEDFEKALDTMKDLSEPNGAHRAAIRSAFLAQAQCFRQQQTISDHGPVRLGEWLNRLFIKENIIMTPLAKAFIIALLASGLATGTVAAANGSMPGQALYPLDVMLEDVQGALALTPGAQARLSLSLAEERGDELITMAEDGETIGDANLEQLQTQLEHCLQAASQLEEPQMLRLLTQLRDMAQTHARQMQRLGIEEGADIMTRTQTQAQRGIDDPQGFQANSRNGLGWPEEPAPEPTDGAEGADQDAIVEGSECDPEAEDCESPQGRHGQVEADQECDSEDENCDSGDSGSDGEPECDPEIEDCEPIQDQDREQDMDQDQDPDMDQDQDQDRDIDQDQAMDGTGDGDGVNAPADDPVDDSGDVPPSDDGDSGSGNNNDDGGNGGGGGN